MLFSVELYLLTLELNPPRDRRRVCVTRGQVKASTVTEDIKSSQKAKPEYKNMTILVREI